LCLTTYGAGCQVLSAGKNTQNQEPRTQNRFEIPTFFHTFILSNIHIMNWIDLGIVVILILSMVSGFTNGLIREIASLAALILGIWGAIKFSSFTAGKMYDYFDMSGHYVGIIAFLITFGIIVVIIHFVGIIADKLADAAALGFVNRLLGIVFGLFKTVLIMSVFFVILNAIDARKPFLPKETIERSMFYNPSYYRGRRI
jgi:membrane protein required for colicin V production